MEASTSDATSVAQVLKGRRSRCLLYKATVRSTFSEFCAWRRDPPQPLHITVKGQFSSPAPSLYNRPECRSASHSRLEHTLPTAHLRPIMSGFGEVLVECANVEHRTDERVNAPCPRHLVRVVSALFVRHQEPCNLTRLSRWRPASRSGAAVDPKRFLPMLPDFALISIVLLRPSSGFATFVQYVP